jgi:hypothetical protein
MIIQVSEIVAVENGAQTINQNGNILAIAMCDAMTGGSAVRAALLLTLDSIIRHGLRVVFCI